MSIDPNNLDQWQAVAESQYNRFSEKVEGGRDLLQKMRELQ